MSRFVKILVPLFGGIALIAGLIAGLNSRSVQAEVPLLEPRTPQQPFNPFGTVKDNGSAVPNGTTIEGYCDGVSWANSQTVIFGTPPESWYDLELPGDDPDTGAIEGCLPGDTVTFQIDGQTAYQTASWASGVPARIELTINEPAPALLVSKELVDSGGNKPPNSTVLAGSTITWTFTLTNSGNVTLFPVEVTDDNGTPADDSDDLDCTVNRLVPGYQATCSMTTTAQLGKITSSGRADGYFYQVIVSDTVSGSYFGADPQIDLGLLLNDQEIDGPPGPTVLAGEKVTWTYAITNTGNISLTALTVTDNAIGQVCQIAFLGIDASAAPCQATSTAVEGEFTNTASVSSSALYINTPTGDMDTSYYFGADPQLDLETLVNGLDADQAPGPSILVGETVSWTFVVENTGNVSLDGIEVSDETVTTGGINRRDSICTIGHLDPGQSAKCNRDGEPAVAGQNARLGTATSTYLSRQVSDQDPGYYLGVGQLKWYIYLPSMTKVP